MKPIRALATNTKLYASCALMFGLAAIAVITLLVQLGDLGQPASGGNGARAAQQLQAEVASIRTWGVALLVLGAVVSGLVCAWLSRELSRPMREAAQFARRLAEGDLHGRIACQAGGEAGQLLAALQQMGERLGEMMKDVRAGTDELVRGSDEIASGSMDLSSRTEQQAASLEETASSMEQLTATVKQNADHAHQASKLAISASEVAVKGGEVVSEVVGTMASINDSSKRIAEIIGVIDGIAFQTNILALNAAVEAARAGEQGRGFAVVASEVRSLAQRSAAAAKEIKELIDDSVQKVNAGTQLADKAGNTMSEVVTSVKRVTDIIAEIADASAEQTVGIEQVNQAIAAMDQATQRNATLVEESAAAAASMREQAGSLTRLVSAFSSDAPQTRQVVAAQPQRQAGKPGAAQAKAQAQPQPQPRTAPKAQPAPQAAQPQRPAQPRKQAAAGGSRRSNAMPAEDWEEF